MRNSETTVTASGVRVNNDSLAYLAARKLERPAVEWCTEHPAFEADYCPACGTV